MDVVTDGESLHLMEHGRMRHVGVAAEGPAGRDDAIWRRRRLHVTNLHGRCMRPQQQRRATLFRLQIKRVVHLPGGVFGRNVERREVVKVVLDVRTFGDGETHVGENRNDLVDDLRHRVYAALRLGAGRQRDVNTLRFQLFRQGGVLKRVAARLDGRCDLVLERVERRAARPPVRSIDGTEPLHQGGDGTLSAEGTDPQGFEVFQTAGGLDIRT